MKDEARFFLRAAACVTSSNDYKEQHGRFRLCIRKNFFTLMKHWNNFPWGVHGISVLTDFPNLAVGIYSYPALRLGIVLISARAYPRYLIEVFYRQY